MKIHEYDQMMAYMLRPATGDREKFAIGTKPDTVPNTQFAALADDLEPGSLKDEMLKDFDPSQETYEEYLQRKSLEDSTMGPGGYQMTASKLDLLKPKTYIDAKNTAVQGFGMLKKAAEKYNVPLKEWIKKNKSEKDRIAYEYRQKNKDQDLRTLDDYMRVPEEKLIRIEPSAETLAKTNEELIAELRLRRNMNTPEYWTNLEALSKNTGKSIQMLEKELAPEGKKIFPFAEKLRARFDKDTIATMFPTAKTLSRIKEYEELFKVNNKKPINFAAKGSSSPNYQENPNLFDQRIELIKNKNFDMDALYTEGELKQIFNSPNFNIRYVESVLPDAIKREGPTIAKKGVEGGVKQPLISINNVIKAFKTKVSTPTKSPRAITFSGRKAQQEIDEGLFKVTGTSFRKVLSRKIKENSKTKKIEAFTAGGKIDQNITPILQKYDVKIPQIAHLNPVEFATRKILSGTTDQTKSLDSLLGDPKFPGFTKNINELYTTENLGFQGRFFNSNVLGRQIQKELKDVYKDMQPIILKYQNKKVPLAVQREIEKLNGQANRLLKKSRDAQSRFKKEMTGAAKNFEDLYSGTLGKTGPYGEVRLAESMGQNELKVINLNKTKGSPFIVNKSKGALNVDAKNWSDLSDSAKVKAKQSWFNNFKSKMLTQIPDANEKKIVEEYLDLYISPIEQRIKNIDPISGKSVARVEDARRTDTSYSEGGRVNLAEGSEGLPSETLPAIATAAYKAGKPITNFAKGAFKTVISPAVASAFAGSEMMDINPFRFAEEDEEGFVKLDEKFLSEKEGGNQSLAGLDLLYPNIARALGSKITTVKNFYNTLLNMGIPLKYAPRLISGMTGVGLIMIGGDAVQGLASLAGPNKRGPLTEEELIEMENKRTAMPRMLDTYEQAIKIAKDENISYSEALEKLKK